MEELILQWGFDHDSQTTIQELRSYIRINELVDRQRGWLPHITIDIYSVEDRGQFINLVEEVIPSLSKIRLHLNELDNFDEGTLYIKPSELELLRELKIRFDEKLDLFRQDSRRKRAYNPHITLCTNSSLEESRRVAMQKFKPMETDVCYVFLYNKNMQLIKKWTLE